MDEHSNCTPMTGYKTLIDQNSAGIYEIRDDEFSYINHRFAELFGYAREELLGMSPFTVVAEGDYQALREDLATLARGETKSVTTERTGVKKDGSKVAVRVHGTVVDRESHPVYLGFVEDITDEKQRERRYEDIFHNTFQFAGLVEPDGTVLEANRTALYFGGLDRDDVVGKPLWETYWFQSTETARETAREAVEHARKGHQFRDETLVQGEDQEIVIDFSIRPVTDDDGAPTGLVVEGHDITDRKERERERQTIIDRVTDAVVEVDADWRFTLVDDRAEEIYDMNEQELLGQYFWDVFDGTRGTRFEEAYRSVMQSREPATLEEYDTDLDGWFHVEVYPESDGGLAFYFQDITDRKRHEERTAGLNEMLSACMDAGSKQEVCDIVTDAAAGQLYLPVMAVALIGDRGGLRPVAKSDPARDVLNVLDLLDRENGIGWRVFTAGEPTVVDDPSPYLSDGGSMDRLVIHPLGRHGVLITASQFPDAEFVQTVAEDVHRAFDRIDRQRHLQNRDDLLEKQNKSLNRLNRINNVIRSIDQVLVRASTRTEIEQAVCEKLTEGDTYTFAWIGGYGSTGNQVYPRESCGHQQGYLESITLDGGDDGADAPAEAAVRSRDPLVETDLLTDPPHEAWREAALRRGYRSVISIPLTYRDSLYGVLTVYSDRPELFGGMEQQVLTELGETVGHAINAVESKQALVSDSVVELELATDLSGHPLTEFVEQDTGREFEFENVALSEKGRYRVFYRMLGTTPEEYLEFVDRTVAVQSSQLIAEDDGADFYESIVTDESLLFWLLDRGAVPQSFTVTQERGRLEVEISADTHIREFVERFEDKYPGTELVARRERERTSRSQQEFEIAVNEQLTARQNEVLQTAYFSGYFESPRDRTGKEIAESLGVSAPTVSDHIRAGLRNLLALLYEDDETGR